MPVLDKWNKDITRSEMDKTPTTIDTTSTTTDTTPKQNTIKNIIVRTTMEYTIQPEPTEIVKKKVNQKIQSNRVILIILKTETTNRLQIKVTKLKNKMKTEREAKDRFIKIIQKIKMNIKRRDVEEKKWRYGTVGLIIIILVMLLVLVYQVALLSL